MAVQLLVVRTVHASVAGGGGAGAREGCWVVTARTSPLPTWWAGLAILERNWRCAAGRDRHRGARRRGARRVRGEDPAGVAFGSPLEAVTARKAARLRRLAAAWVHERQVHPLEIRIDLVGVLRAGRGAAEVEHVRGVA